MRQFIIHRDLSLYSYNKGSEVPFMTQFDKGTRLSFVLTNKKQIVPLQSYRVFISFKHESGEVILTEECALVKDLSLHKGDLCCYVMDERLTQKEGELTAILDVFDPDGNRFALLPFKMVVLPHLLKEPVNT